MYQTTLRIGDELASRARSRSDDLGITLNALVCVALDAYLRGPVATVDDPPGQGGAHPPEAVVSVQHVQQVTPKQRYDAKQAQRRAKRRGG